MLSEGRVQSVLSEAGEGITRSQARGRDLADEGVARGTQRNADACSCEEVPRGH